jgi:hypothetical protein
MTRRRTLAPTLGHSIETTMFNRIIVIGISYDSKMRRLLVGFALLAACTSDDASSPRQTEALGRVNSAISVGPATVRTTNLNSADFQAWDEAGVVAATPTGYVVAHAEPTAITKEFNVVVTFLSADGTVESGPFTFLSPQPTTGNAWQPVASPNFALRGVTWDGANAFVVAVRKSDSCNVCQFVTGHQISPTGTVTQVFGFDDVHDESYFSEGRNFYRPVATSAGLFVSGTRGNNPFGSQLCVDGQKYYPGGLTVSSTPTPIDCGTAVIGPGNAGVCIGYYFYHDPCLSFPNTFTYRLRFNTLPPGAPIEVTLPNYNLFPKRAAVHDDVLVFVGERSVNTTEALAYTTSGTLIGPAPIPGLFRGDVAWVVDRFLAVDQEAGGIAAGTLSADGTQVVDAFATLVATGQRPSLAPRDDGNALLAYHDGATLYTAVISVTQPAGGGGGGAGGGSAGSGGAGGSPSGSGGAASTSVGTSGVGGSGGSTSTGGGWGGNGGAGGAGGEGGAGGASSSISSSGSSTTTASSSSSSSSTNSSSTVASTSATSTTAASMTAGSGGAGGEGGSGSDGEGCSLTTPAAASERSGTWLFLAVALLLSRRRRALRDR